MTNTTNYGLKKPDSTDFYDVSVQNDNMDIIDQKLKEIANAGSAGAIVDNLESDRSDLALSARQGKILNECLGGLRFGTDGDGNYGYYGADGSLIPFKSGEVKEIEILPLVPILTSNTGSDGGEASCYKLNANGGEAYLTFDGNTANYVDTHYGKDGIVSNIWYQYKFTTPTVVKKLMIYENARSDIAKLCTAKVQYSNDGTTWNDLYTIDMTNSTPGTDVFCDVENTSDISALYWRLQCLTSTNGTKVFISELQFYGYKLEALIPTMTSNTTPSGEVIYSAQYVSSNDSYRMWKAFDGDSSTMGAFTNAVDGYLGYKFTSPVCVKYFECISDSTDDFKLQASNDNSEWVDLYELTSNTLSTNVENNNSYLYYRVIQTSKKTYSGGTGFYTLQFYGTPKVSSDDGVILSKQDSGSYTTINAEQTITTNLKKINYLVTWWANGVGTECVWLNGEPYGKINDTLKVNGNTFSHKSGNVGYVLNWLVLGE